MTMKLHKSKWIKRLTLSVVGFLLALIIYGLLQLIDPVPITPVAQASQPRFAGRALLVASDADMVATAYIDGIPDKVPGIEDTLSVISLPLNRANPIATVPVPNSVTAWPQIIATSPDGTKAYVVELRGKLPENVQKLNPTVPGIGLPDGSLLTVVDLTNPRKPFVVESVPIGRVPAHISASPDGKFLAITLDGEKGKELLVVSIENGKLGKRHNFTFKNSTGQAVSRVNSVNWHPSGRFLALNFDNQEVAFYEVLSDVSGSVNLRPYGQPVAVGNTLSIGRFAPDGRHFLITEVNWGTWNLPRGAFTQQFGFLNYFANPKGELVSIRFDGGSGQVIQPEVVSRAAVGLSPEGFALSPDGSLAATVNMRRTYIPTNWLSWRGKRHSSLSLVKVNRQTGELTTLGKEYGFEGLLPENAAFDAEGDALAVVIFHDRQQSPRKGTVEFWNVIKGEEARLERTGFKIDVTRGPHDITLVR
jgi:DNA-binding beta-propeller fold protein YncE